jgi:hypothetical protein
MTTQAAHYPFTRPAQRRRAQHMNSIEHGIVDALKGLGIVASGAGVARLAWLGASRLWGWLPGYIKGERQQAIDVRKVVVEERKLEQVSTQAESDRIQKAQALLDGGFTTLIATCQGQIKNLADDLERVKVRLSTEEELRRMAALSADAAHIRADEADIQRLRALTEIATLRKENTSLRKVVAEATQSARDDRTLIAEQKIALAQMSARIEENNVKIAELQAKLDSFETGTFEMAPGTFGITHVNAVGVETPGEEL